MHRNYYNIVIVIFALIVSAQTRPLEHATLHNIRQITFPSMGFEKSGESYFSPDGKTLIFQAIPTGEKNYQIYSIDIEKGKPRLISTGRGACTCAFFRPDGKKIIFASSHDAPDNSADEQKVPGYQRDSKNYVWEFTSYMNIYQADPDGSNLVALTTGPAYKAECSYSSDGSHIVFASNSSGHMNLYTMRPDGSHIQQITHTTTGYNGGPFFSPNGSKILYRADYEKQHYLQIYCIDTQTGQTQQLTTNKAVNWAPFWHPNGEVIVFTTSLHGHTQYELYLLNIKTKTLQRLTYNPSFDGLASFNKDGTQITWTSKRGPDQTCQVFVADFVMPESLYTGKT
jgi:TolB protein